MNKFMISASVLVAAAASMAAANPTVGGYSLTAGLSNTTTFSGIAIRDVVMAMTTPVSGLPANFRNPDTTATLADSTGTIASNDDGGSTNLPVSLWGSTVRGYARAAEPLTLTVAGFNAAQAGDYILTTGVYNIDMQLPRATQNANGVGGTALPLLSGYGVAMALAEVSGTNSPVFFAITLNQGDILSVMTAGTSSADFDTVIGLRLGSGVTDVTNDDGGNGLGSSFRYLAPTSGTFYLAIDGFDSDVTGNAIVLASVIPTPSAAALLGLGGLIAARRRRA